jgi:hypothetical protein
MKDDQYKDPPDDDDDTAPEPIKVGGKCSECNGSQWIEGTDAKGRPGVRPCSACHPLGRKGAA